MAAPRRKLIAGIGSALVDILLQEDDHFLAESGAQKGGMLLVDSKKIDELHARAKCAPYIVPGGSACNTIIGIGRLGGPARFVGKRGNDVLGNLFSEGLKSNNVEQNLFISSSPTGRVLSIITPDAQRSMLTFLGASSETQVSEITADVFKDAALVHVEGYLLFNHSLMNAALKAARRAGAKVSLDLASYTVVEQNRNILDEIVKDSIDILIANEDEARAFTGHTDEQKALKVLSEKVPTAVVKIGKRGSYIAHGGKSLHVGIKGDGRAIDTTGAGDLWAAGFLFGLVNDYPIEKCGKLGAACGYEVCQVIGASIPDDGWERIKAEMI
jgi:sugar/nucleoside kinase (ribokinase family)